MAYVVPHMPVDKPTVTPQWSAWSAKVRYQGLSGCSALSTSTVTFAEPAVTLPAPALKLAPVAVLAASSAATEHVPNSPTEPVILLPRLDVLRPDADDEMDTVEMKIG